MVEILKQGQFSPLPVEKQVLIIYAGTTGLLDDLPLEQCRPFEQELYKWIENAHPAILTTIREKKALDDSLKSQMDSALKEFKASFAKKGSAAKA
jgi:F-type H+/Na+-transporting ATPase subunit alpha